jgi:hypothetical protein
MPGSLRDFFSKGEILDITTGEPHEALETDGYRPF